MNKNRNRVPAFAGNDEAVCNSGSHLIQPQTVEMLDPARRDDQTVHSGRVEHEAERGFGHGLLARLGRLPQPLDRGEGLLRRIAGADLRRVGERGCRAAAARPGDTCR